LLTNRVEINAREINNKTLLHYEAMNEKVELAEHLLNRGADSSAQNKNQFSALHLTASNKNKLNIKLLVKIS